MLREALNIGFNINSRRNGFRACNQEFLLNFHDIWKTSKYSHTAFSSSKLLVIIDDHCHIIVESVYFNDKTILNCKSI